MTKYDSPVDDFERKVKAVKSEPTLSSSPTSKTAPTSSSSRHHRHANGKGYSVQSSAKVVPSSKASSSHHKWRHVC